MRRDEGWFTFPSIPQIVTNVKHSFYGTNERSVSYLNFSFTCKRSGIRLGKNSTVIHKPQAIYPSKSRHQIDAKNEIHSNDICLQKKIKSYYLALLVGVSTAVSPSKIHLTAGSPCYFDVFFYVKLLSLHCSLIPA